MCILRDTDNIHLVIKITDRTMDSVQNCDSYINIPSLHIQKII
jgi:hypothetical protein